MEQFLQRILQEIMKKIILGTSDAWSVVRLDKWTSERAWYIIDLRISSKYLQDSLAAFCVFVFSLFPLKKPSWKLNLLHIFAISSSSRHEKRCQILERLSKNILHTYKANTIDLSVIPFEKPQTDVQTMNLVRCKPHG